jgi:hypothetical protein
MRFEDARVIKQLRNQAMHGFPHELDNVVAAPVGQDRRGFHELVQKSIVGKTKKSVSIDGILKKKSVSRYKDVSDKGLTVVFHGDLHK